MTHNFTLHSKTHKSYASLENLEAAITKLGIADIVHIVCKTTDDRWTAVFCAVNRPEHFQRVFGTGFMTVM